MKKFIFILLIWGNVSLAQSPLITQTYTDRCTKEIFTFSVLSNNQTVIVFYNKSKVFNSNDFTNGTLQLWLEETYNWWRSINPCSPLQSSTTIAQQTSQQIASATTQTSLNIPSPKNETSTPQEQSSDVSESQNSEEKEEKESNSQSPPIVVANLAGMQGIDGRFTTALSLGINKSSLLGDKSYGVNSMIWTNFQQFLITGNISKTYTLNGKVDMISSTSLSIAKMYSTYLFSLGHSKVFPGQNKSIFGFNFTHNIMSIKPGGSFERKLSGSFNSILFYTIPFNLSSFSFNPMVALASTLFTYSLNIQNIDMPHSHILILGNNFNYSITQRFVANLGLILTSSLSSEFPTTFALTIGSRFQF